ncbi:MAG: HD domain-containing protein, partial [Candidatus Binatia bacterium]
VERRIVRAIGDPRSRFAEDKLRLIRGVRFAARLGFRLDPDTASAAREMAPQIHQVSHERIGEEIVKILTEGAARRGFELLSETALLREVLPEIEAMRGVEQGRDHHPEGDVFVHTMLALGEFDGAEARDRLLASTEEDARARLEALALGILLHDVAKPECRQVVDGKITFYGHCERGAEITLEICRRLRRSNAVAERASWLVRNHLRLLNAPDMRLATLKRFLREEPIEDLLELCRIDAAASSGNFFHYEFCREALRRFSAEAMKPPPLLTGRDLIELGHEPGPSFQTILSAVEEAQLEGVITSRDEALRFVRDRFPAKAS